MRNRLAHVAQAAKELYVARWLNQPRRQEDRTTVSSRRPSRSSTCNPFRVSKNSICSAKMEVSCILVLQRVCVIVLAPCCPCCGGFLPAVEGYGRGGAL